MPWATVALLAVVGCYRVDSRLLETPEPPGDLYRCLQLELGRAGYAIVGADRASGWLHAQRRIERIHEIVTAEVYATVIADEGAGSHLQLTENTHASQDAELLLETCAPGARIAGGDRGTAFPHFPGTTTRSRSSTGTVRSSSSSARMFRRK